MSVLQSQDTHLQIRHVSHHYEQKLALQNVSLDVAKSEILALLGPSGSGKSTLLATIAGMVTPHSGEILLGGLNLLKLPPEARRLGMVFQDYALWPHMTIAQNVAFPLRARKYPPQKINSRVEEALRRVSLQDSSRAVPISCPAANSRESPSPAPSLPTQSCFCSMNPFPRWIRQPDPASAASWPRY